MEKRSNLAVSLGKKLLTGGKALASGAKMMGRKSLSKPGLKVLGESAKGTVKSLTGKEKLLSLGIGAAGLGGSSFAAGRMSKKGSINGGLVMDLQDFAYEYIKEASVGSALRTGYQAVKAVGAPGSIAKAKLLSSVASGTSKRTGKEAYKGLGSVIGSVKGALTRASKYFGRPVKSIRELKSIAAEKGWSARDVVKIMHGEKIIGKGMGSGAAREALKGLGKKMGKGALRAGAIGGVGAGGYAMGKKKK